MDNDEIIKKHGVNKNEPMLKDMLDEARADTINEIQKKSGEVLIKSIEKGEITLLIPKSWGKAKLERARAEGYNKGKGDTAKQIFEDLFVIAGHLQANEYNNGILKEMQALKKKYGVD